MSKKQAKRFVKAINAHYESDDFKHDYALALIEDVSTIDYNLQRPAAAKLLEHCGIDRQEFIDWLDVDIAETHMQSVDNAYGHGMGITISSHQLSELYQEVGNDELARLDFSRQQLNKAMENDCWNVSDDGSFVKATYLSFYLELTEEIVNEFKKNKEA